MATQKKKSSSSKSSKYELSHDSKSTKGSTILDTINQEDNFQFWNGDSYYGAFKATRGGSIWREGHGKYVTGDGQTYQGVWHTDTLTNDATICFADKSYYIGGVENLQYNGNGTYMLPDTSVLTGMFTANQPVNTLTLTDPNGHVWQGNAGIKNVLLVPCNRFLPQ